LNLVLIPVRGDFFFQIMMPPLKACGVRQKPMPSHRTLAPIVPPVLSFSKMEKGGRIMSDLLGTTPLLPVSLDFLVC